MNIYLNIENFNINNIYYHEPINNTVINDSFFIKIIYSNHLFITNGLHIKISIDDNFSINFLTNLEKNILYLYNRDTKFNLKIKDQFNYYINKHNSKNLILKISGIWENKNGIGITSKFIII